MHRDTRIQHHGEDSEQRLGSVTPAIYRSSLFAFPDCASLERAFQGDPSRSLYSRVSNPTVRVLEEKVADLEGGEDAVAFASGMGAISAVLLGLLARGDHLVLFSRVYSPTLTFARDVLRRFGVEVSFLDLAELAALERHLEDNTRLVYVESPASLTMELLDLEAVARTARSRGIATVTDNSWATPIFQRPLELGIDLVVHSGTKYLSGHSDILLGLVAGGRSRVDRVRSTAISLGASLSPEDAFLAIRGLRTLPLRMERHQASAFLLARRLLDHARVAEVLHPALPFFPTHALWQRQCSGASGLFSFRLRGDPRRFCDALGIFQLGVSWGGFESLALPSSVIAKGYAANNPRPDVPDDLVRLSVGLEDADDLWQDLEQALAAS
jgi:cystathionine beta-lyase